jgi:hypothetical protein
MYQDEKSVNELPKEFLDFSQGIFKFVYPIIASLVYYYFLQEEKPNNFNKLSIKSGLKKILNEVKLHPLTTSKSQLVAATESF